MLQPFSDSEVVRYRTGTRRRGYVHRTMFTGLIEQTGVVKSLTHSGGLVRLAISASDWLHVPMVGESIAIDGCCLTLASPAGGGLLEFDVVSETLEKTTLGELKPGDRVHLEASCTPNTLLGGHIVQGHVDSVASVLHVHEGDDWRVRLAVPDDLIEFVVPKGSVCLAGVSLTVAAQSTVDRWLEVALIPTTLNKTKLGSWRTGTRVNIECDVMSKTIVHWLRNFASIAPRH